MATGAALGAMLLTSVGFLPAIDTARKRHETGKGQGLIIGASVTFLLDAACWGAFNFFPLLGPF